ncbi:hypothetical protein [Candidatus Chloroploca sp. Khr17]|uniref:hypothetical protein n=1 Tax=Candidatus Chloroploca sp. Khr17 TaxID=2496869 RepID=UPI00101CEBC4|nr:hypothetical protein [Candidatus Chloroploca sp. Khr17]
MIVDIELTRRSHDRYVARALQFPDVEVEAVSREAALAQIREALTARRRAGSEIVQITIDNGSAALQAAWPHHAGAFPDDEAYRSMLAEVERQRRELNEDAEA